MYCYQIWWHAHCKWLKIKINTINFINYIGNKWVPAQDWGAVNCMYFCVHLHKLGYNFCSKMNNCLLHVFPLPQTCGTLYSTKVSSHRPLLHMQLVGVMDAILKVPYDVIPKIRNFSSTPHTGVIAEIIVNVMGNLIFGSTPYTVKVCLLAHSVYLRVAVAHRKHNHPKRPRAICGSHFQVQSTTGASGSEICFSWDALAALHTKTIQCITYYTCYLLAQICVRISCWKMNSSLLHVMPSSHTNPCAGNVVSALHFNLHKCKTDKIG